VLQMWQLPPRNLSGDRQEMFELSENWTLRQSMQRSEGDNVNFECSVSIACFAHNRVSLQSRQTGARGGRDREHRREERKN
jgi:hypothetical protein